MPSVVLCKEHERSQSRVSDINSDRTMFTQIPPLLSPPLLHAERREGGDGGDGSGGGDEG